MTGILRFSLISSFHVCFTMVFFFGDFNDLLYITDKKGRHPHPQRLLDGFKNAIEDCSLTEVDLKGGKFT